MSAEPVVFRVSRRRLVVGTVSIVALALLVIRGLFMVAVVAAGVPLDFSDFVDAVLSTLVPAVAIAVGVGAGTRQNPGWVRVSAEGLEFAAARHRPTFLPWAGVATVRRRFAGPFTQLLVTPAGPDAFFHAQTSGRIPRLRKGAFVIDAGLLTPGPTALLAEVQRRRDVLTR